MSCEKDGVINNIETRINVVDTTLSDIDNKLGSIDVTLARNTTSLEHHVLRSDRLETVIARVEERSYQLSNKTNWLLGIIGASSIIIPIVVALLK